MANIKYRKSFNSNDPPWFDKSCRDLKTAMKNLGKKIRANSNDQSSKSELYTEKRAKEVNTK